MQVSQAPPYVRQVSCAEKRGKIFVCYQEGGESPNNVRLKWQKLKKLVFTVHLKNVENGTVCLILVYNILIKFLLTVMVLNI